MELVLLEVRNRARVQSQLSHHLKLFPLEEFLDGSLNVPIQSILPAVKLLLIHEDRTERRLVLLQLF